jgi:septum formation protein
MTDEEIYGYIATKDPMDKAGAYGIQGQFGMFIEKIDGDYLNVVGLPLARLWQELKQNRLV